MPQSVSLAFLGCGVATRTHSKVLSRFGGDVQRYYASRDGTKAETFCARHGGAGWFAGYDVALRDERRPSEIPST